jgi:nucleoid DNA-binding protein
MYANHPAMARRWSKHTPKGRRLPERVASLDIDPHAMIKRVVNAKPGAKQLVRHYEVLDHHQFLKCAALYRIKLHALQDSHHFECVGTAADFAQFDRRLEDAARPMSMSMGANLDGWLDPVGRFHPLSDYRSFHEDVIKRLRGKVTANPVHDAIVAGYSRLRRIGGDLYADTSADKVDLVTRFARQHASGTGELFITVPGGGQQRVELSAAMAHEHDKGAHVNLLFEAFSRRAAQNFVGRIEGNVPGAIVRYKNERLQGGGPIQIRVISDNAKNVLFVAAHSGVRHVQSFSASLSTEHPTRILSLQFPSRQMARAFLDMARRMPAVHIKVRASDLKIVIKSAGDLGGLRWAAERFGAEVLTDKALGFDPYPQGITSLAHGWRPTSLPTEISEETVRSRRDIARVVADELRITQTAASPVVKQTLETIADVLVKNGRVELRGFGVFELRIRRARKAIDPSRGHEEIRVPDKVTVVFKPSKLLNQRVSPASFSGAYAGRPVKTYFQSEDEAHGFISEIYKLQPGVTLKNMTITRTKHGWEVLVYAQGAESVIRKLASKCGGSSGRDFAMGMRGTLKPVIHVIEQGRVIGDDSHDPIIGQLKLHAFHPETKKQIGEVHFDVHRGKRLQVEHIRVNDDYRRMGVGSALLDYVESRGWKIMSGSYQTADGKAFRPQHGQGFAAIACSLASRLGGTFSFS